VSRKAGDAAVDAYLGRGSSATSRLLNVSNGLTAPSRLAVSPAAVFFTLCGATVAGIRRPTPGDEPVAAPRRGPNPHTQVAVSSKVHGADGKWLGKTVQARAAVTSAMVIGWWVMAR
jgi:hypothetical protein